MGKAVDEPRNEFVGIRLTEKEALLLRGQMAGAGYNSLSRYVRERILQERRLFRADKPLDAKDVRDMLNALTSRVSQTGVDCDRFACNYDRLMSSMDSKGDESRKSTALYHMRSMSRSMNQMARQVDRILDVFLEMDRTAGSRKESSILTNSKDKMLQRIEIIGTVVQDAELRTGKDGKQFIVFRVGVKEDYGEERRSTYFDVTNPYTKVFEYLKVGKKVYVSGRLTISDHEKDGKVWKNLKISARELELLDRGDR